VGINIYKKRTPSEIQMYKCTFPKKSIKVLSIAELEKFFEDHPSLIDKATDINADADMQFHQSAGV
jgi:hypothetical protein